MTTPANTMQTSGAGACCRPREAAAAERRADAMTFTPLCDIGETRDAFIVRADVPGATAEDLDITFLEGSLTIDAGVRPRPHRSTGAVVEEYGVGRFTRGFTIATPVDADRISAALRDGVLTVTIPKAESARPRRIQVRAAS